jgi:taurine dioxygenase
MTLALRKVSPILGAEVKGIDLSAPVAPETIEELTQAVAEYGVLVFPDQHLPPEQHLRFTRRFGPLEEHVLSDALLPGHPEIYVLSNVVENGKPQGRSYAGTYWHSDLSYVKEPSLGSMLYALEVPEVGGDTLFASMYRAYETLSRGLQRLLEGLEAVHDFAHADKLYFSKRTDGGQLTAAQKARTPPVTHPVLRTHPVSGRRALFVNPGFTAHFADMSPEESQPLLQYLFQHAIQPAFVYRHRWRRGDLVFWDNRCTMHQAIRDYGPDEHRHMHRTTVRGESPFLQ